MANIVIVLGGQVLPQVDVPFKEITEPVESNNVTLDGTLYTDWVATRRSWSLTWGVLSKTEYDTIRAIFNSQYSNEAYPILQISYYSILVPVKVEISEKDIRWDGNCVRDFSIKLIEQYAVS